MIVVRFKMKCKADQTAQALAALRDVVDPSRKLDGAISFDIGQDITDPDSLKATEIFEDRAALDRQESLPQVERVIGLLGELLAEDPEAHPPSRVFVRTVGRLGQSHSFVVRWLDRAPRLNSLPADSVPPLAAIPSGTCSAVYDRAVLGQGRWRRSMGEKPTEADELQRQAGGNTAPAGIAVKEEGVSENAIAVSDPGVPGRVFSETNREGFAINEPGTAAKTAPERPPQGQEEAGGGPDGPAGLAVSDPGAPGDKPKTK